MSAKFVFLILLIFLTGGCGNRKETISAQEKIIVYMTFVENLKPLTKDMSVSFAEYLTYNKSNSQFMEDINSFKKRYAEHEKRWQNFNRQYEVLNPPEALVAAISGIEAAKQAIHTVLGEALQDGEPKKREDILFMYLTQMQIMQDGLEVFKINVPKIFQ